MDWGCKTCFQVQAFILSDTGDQAEALVLLQRIEKPAPASANTACEVGFVLIWQGKHEEAAAAYHRAYDLTVRFASQRDMRAMALRVMGFVLRELRRFDEAKRACRESLEIEASNSLTLGELTYRSISA